MAQLSVRAKILLVTTTILVATVVAYAVVVGYAFKARYTRVLESESLFVAQGLKLQLDRLFALGLSLEAVEGFEQQCLEAVQDHEDVSYAVVVNREGRILFHSDRTLRGLERNARPFTEETVDVSDASGVSYLDTTLPVRDPNGQFVGAVRVGVPKSRISEETSQLLASFVGLGGLLLALATTLLVATLSFSVHRPLSKLVRVIRRVGAESDLTERVEVTSADELGQLGTAFNRMLATIASSQAEVESYARDLERKTVELEEVNERLHDDIRERERAEEALRKSEERFRRYFELSLMGMAIVSTERRFFEVNDKLCAISGYEREELEQMTLTGVVRGEERGRVEAELDKIANGSSAGFTLDTRVLHRDGEDIHVTVSARSVTRGDGEVDYLIVLVLDITERKRAEEVFLQSQKLESLGLLAGGVAHDFNNLLTAMLVQSSLALGKLPPHSDAHSHLEKVVKATERASDLTRQLLAYSGRAQFEIQPMQLNEFIQEGLPLFELAMPKNIRVRPELGEAVPTVVADKGQMQQVIMNLVINAAEAIGEEQGTVVVSTSVEHLSGSDGYVWTFDGEPLPPGPYVGVAVSDDGSGMDSGTLSKIFDPFFSTKFTGRGLGLAAVLGVVRGHRGAIQVTSHPGAGTTFKLLFPASDAEVPVIAPDETGSAAPFRGAVLVVDDEDIVREAAADILRSEGVHVLTAEDGAAGIRLFRKSASEVSVVLLDLSMPGLNGVETFAELRKIRPDVPVILTSGYSEEEVVDRFQNVSMMSFLKKPFSAGKLIELVSQHAASIVGSER